MRQVFQMFLIDMKMSMKSFMGGYIIIVPILALLILRGFLPSVESTSANIAVVTSGPNAVEAGLVEELESFAHVSTYENVESLEQKLRGAGSTEGLYRDPTTGQYVSVLERSLESNRAFSVGARVVRQYTLGKIRPGTGRITRFEYGVPVELSNRTKTSPVATTGGAIFLVFLVIASGFIIGMGIVNDKEDGTDRAIRVSPVSKADYFIGKSIYPFMVILFYTIIGLLLLKLLHVNVLMTYTVAIISYSLSLLFGLLVGAIASNENEAIGLAKMLATVSMLSLLGGTLLPDRWQWVVWWSPLYWIFDIMEEVFTDTAAWGTLAWKSAVILGLTATYFLLLKKRIVRGLS
ncbi:MAG: ABC transporter permease [Spirochaetales bacterium]|nr:ABC transporter permease [Spirochaetales bacterium]